MLLSHEVIEETLKEDEGVNDTCIFYGVVQSGVDLNA